MIARMYFKG